MQSYEQNGGDSGDRRGGGNGGGYRGLYDEPKKNPGKKLKQNATKAIKTLGTVLDSVEYMMR
ncbi:MAG: hypothetical protein ACLVL7_08585 [Anaerotruncus massiliensis (ex Togo et al. 2019)]